MNNKIICAFCDKQTDDYKIIETKEIVCQDCLERETEFYYNYVEGNGLYNHETD
jgi:hypothetical protein